MDLPDLTNLTIVELLATLLFFTFLDTAAAYVVAFMNGNFTAAYALDFLRTHILKAGGPIALLAIVGHGIPGFVPAIPAAGAFAVASLGVYILVTVASIKDTFGDKGIPPTPSTNVAPVVEPAG